MSKAVKNKNVLTHIYVVDADRVKRFEAKYRENDGALYSKNSYHTHRLGIDAFATRESAEKLLKRKTERRLRFLHADLASMQKRKESSMRNFDRVLARLRKEIAKLEKKLNG